jgi:hypothetical protein
MHVRRKVAAVGLGVVTLLGGTVSPAAAELEKVAGCPKDRWGTADRAGRVSEPTRYRVYLTRYAYCVTVKTYSSGAKPLRITRTNNYWNGCRVTTERNSISKYGYKLAGVGERSRYTYLTISDGTRTVKLTLGRTSPPDC